jgi:mannose-1-phosphate guanylyltransferase
VQGLLLIGGLATRLQPLSRHLAKSLLPICDRELLHYQIVQLASAGIGDIILAAGYHSQQLADYAASYSGIALTVCEESEPRGTAGAIRNAQELLSGEPLVVLNADILSDVILSKVLDSHRLSGAKGTLTGVSVEDPARFGLLRLRDNEIIGFAEKPEGQVAPGPHYINAGIYVLEPELVETIPAGRSVSIERETFPQAIEKFGPLNHYPHSGLWLDIGTFEGYFAANFALLARRFTFGPDWLWGERSDCAVFKDQVYIHTSASFGAGTDLYHRVIAMAGTSIGASSRLENTILMPGARIGEGCSVSSAIIGPGVEVEPGATVANTVLVLGEEPTPFFPAAR